MYRRLASSTCRTLKFPNQLGFRPIQGQVLSAGKKSNADSQRQRDPTFSSAPCRQYSAPANPIEWLRERTRLAGVPAQNAAPKVYNDEFRRTEDTTLWDVEGSGSSLLLDGKTVRLSHPHVHNLVTLDRHWLRDACTCELCVDPDSGQKNYGTCDVPLELPIQNCRKTAEGELEVVWQNDFLSRQGENHVSKYSADWIQSFFFPAPYGSFKLPNRIFWDKAIFEKDRITLDYNHWMASGRDFVQGMLQLRTHGLLFLKNVPESEESVIHVANQIGNLQETLYGRTWNVRSKPQAENVAYTNSFLGLHQDLLYTVDPPRIQILHCLENTCEGGESLFSDGLRAAHLMKLGPAHFFKPLIHKVLRYEYKKHNHHYQQVRAVVHQNLEKVYWSPPFQASDQNLLKTGQGSKHYRAWVEAATKFRKLLEDDPWMYEYKMKPGECVLFDNLRILHGRKQFDTSSGRRWLKGAYVAHDVYSSKLATLLPRLKELSWEHAKTGPTEQAMTLVDKHGVWDSDAKGERPWGHVPQTSGKTVTDTSF